MVETSRPLKKLASGVLASLGRLGVPEKSGLFEQPSGSAGSGTFSSLFREDR
jgi:hypothetical protein